MFIETLQSDPRFFFAVLIAVVVSICLHELAHGLAAIRCGDNTPIEQDRMTLNPLVHMGVFSILALLIAGIAWGQMPIDRSRLRGRHAEALVAAAGPLANFAIALASLGALGMWQRLAGEAAVEGPAGNGQYLLRTFGYVNFLLGLFNLIPWPPLDGAHILGSFWRWYADLIDRAALSGAAIFGFLLIFVVGIRLITPAAGMLTHHTLSLVRGW
ncbi:MAG: site-2 protease family protein [Phycisphaerae bacterium]|nr:site-2 protease family protein [Phycisphaerae bacterium]